jgi:profilin
MSWQAYVDNNLVGSGYLVKAAIFGNKGGQWAASAGFNVSNDEINKLIAAYKDATGIRATGFHLNGEKYFTLR